MSDQPSSVFEQPVSTETPAAPEVPAATPTPAVPVVPTIAADFVGDGKKYSSVEVALGAIPHAQAHIENLEAENARLREANAGATKLDDVVSQLEANKDQTATPATPEYDPAKMREEARNVYQEISLEDAKQDNQDEANAAIFKLYGDKAPEVTVIRAAQLGVSVAFLQATAQASPAAFMKLITDTPSQDSGMPSVDQSTINSDALIVNQNPDQPTAKVGSMSNTKDVLAGWRGAGKIVEANNN